MKKGIIFVLITLILIAGLFFIFGDKLGKNNNSLKNGSSKISNTNDTNKNPADEIKETDKNSNKTQGVTEPGNGSGVKTFSGGGAGGGGSSESKESPGTTNPPPEDNPPDIPDINKAPCGLYYSRYGICNGTCPEGKCVSEGRSCYCRI